MHYRVDLFASVFIASVVSAQFHLNCQGYKTGMHNWGKKKSLELTADATLTYKLEVEHRNGDCQGISQISVCIVLSDS